MSLDTYINYFWLPVIAASLGLLIYSAILTVKSWRWKFTFLHTLATTVGRRGDQRTLEVSFSAPKLARGFISTAEDDAAHVTLHASIKLGRLQWRRTLERTVIQIMYPPLSCSPKHVPHKMLDSTEREETKNAWYEAQ